MKRTTKLWAIVAALLLATGIGFAADANAAPTVHVSSALSSGDSTLPVPAPTTPTLPTSSRGAAATFTPSCNDFQDIDVAPCNAALAFDDWGAATVHGHSCEQLTSDFAAYFDCSDGYVTVQSQWVPVSLDTGISTYSGETPEYRIDHGVVFWEGAIMPTGGGTFTASAVIDFAASAETGDWTPGAIAEKQLTGSSPATDVRGKLTPAGVALIQTPATAPAHVDLTGLSGYFTAGS